MRRAVVYTMPPEVTDRSSERKVLQAKLENALRASLASIRPAKPIVEILNGNGTAPPLLITGSAVSISGSGYYRAASRWSTTLTSLSESLRESLS
jgi:hypothetical protein